jgi:hypothetical protein
VSPRRLRRRTSMRPVDVSTHSSNSSISPPVSGVSSPLPHKRFQKLRLDDDDDACDPADDAVSGGKIGAAGSATSVGVLAGAEPRHLRTAKTIMPPMTNATSAPTTTTTSCLREPSPSMERIVALWAFCDQRRLRVLRAVGWFAERACDGRRAAGASLACSRERGKSANGHWRGVCANMERRLYVSQTLWQAIFSTCTLEA